MRYARSTDDSLNVIVDRNGKVLHTVIGGKLGDVVATLRAEAGSL